MQLQPDTFYKVTVSVPAIGFSVTSDYLTADEPELADTNWAIASFVLWQNGYEDTCDDLADIAYVTIH